MTVKQDAGRDWHYQRDAYLTIARLLGSTLALGPLLQRIAQHAAQACDMDRCTVFVSCNGWVEPMTSQNANGKVDRHLHPAYRRLGRRQIDDLPIFQEIIRRRGPVILDDLATNPLWPRGWPVESTVVLVVPMIRNREVLGALAFSNSERTDPVQPAQVTCGCTIASQVALVITNARLSAEVERQPDQSGAQIRIARALDSGLELKPLLIQLTRLAAQACDTERCSIYLREEGRLVPMMAQYADPDRKNPGLWETFKSLKKLHLEKLDLFGEMIRRRGPVIIDDPTQDPRWPIVFPQYEDTTILLVPLLRQDEVVGAMSLEGPNPVTPGKVTRATTIASQVALTLDNLQLYRQTRQRLRETQTLLDVAQTIGSSLDRHEIARRTCRQLAKLLEADCCLFYEIDESKECRVAVAGYHVPKRIRDVRRPLPLGERGSFIALAVSSGHAVAISDAANDDRLGVPPIAVVSQPKSLLCVPVMKRAAAQGREAGGLLAFWWQTRHTFRHEELCLAEGIAHQMALVLENARQYETLHKALNDLKEAQTRLIQTEKIRALAEMAGGVAHDFNNLLTAIVGHTELLRHALGSEITTDVRSPLESIELAAGDGRETVRRLLGHARTQEPVETFDVNQLLVDAREVARPRWEGGAQAKGIKVEFIIETTSVPQILGNPAELREVLLNLVYNAVDAMPYGGTLTLSSGVEDRKVWIRVADTGTGMSEDVRNRVFEPFFTTKNARGSGLGLSASYAIVHGHGGTIEVESEPGQGTAFTIRLPR